MSGIEVLNKTIELMQSHGYELSDSSSEHVSEKVQNISLELFWHPLSVIPMFEGVIRIPFQTYDDCNTYYGDGFYKSYLNDITEASKSLFKFENIVETNIEDNNIELSFTINGIEEKLAFNLDEQHDSIPPTFTEYIEKLILKYNAEDKFLKFCDEGDNEDCFILLKKELINSLKEVKDMNFFNEFTVGSEIHYENIAR
ncbi:hypothetical protein [Psychromonas aquimarina]|uniref:hypothetical protein n=1 Tax=Psychromonas aquimarina TaxID=444919 RepID=UPI0003F58D30|nr:hypothetical protein [Psychromonas aquimarina]